MGHVLFAIAGFLTVLGVMMLSAALLIDGEQLPLSFFGGLLTGGGLALTLILVMGD